MHVRFWGTRGSLPKPGPDTLRFGGNTSCVEVRTSSGTLVIIDCGTGLHGLGQALLAARRPADSGHILISHTHWDHIQGIPFFAPFFEPGNKWRIYAPKGLGQSVEDTLAGQMQYSYFPVRLDQMAADIRYHELVEGVFEIDDVRIETRYMNHTALTLGFRLEADGATLVYATDHEPFASHLASGKGKLSGRDRRHCEFMSRADLVIHDAQFTAEEYAGRMGWGHSTIEYAAAVAREAGAARLALTHHDPLRTDDALENLVKATRAVELPASAIVDIFAAAEGQVIELGSTVTPLLPKTAKQGSPANVSALAKPSLVLSIDDPVAAEIIREVARADGISLIQAGNACEALAMARAAMPAVVMIDGTNTICCPDAKTTHRSSVFDVPVIVVAGEEPGLQIAEARGTTDVDVLIAPFSAAYARTFIRASLLRTACRWQRALTTPDEERRLELLHGLGILDTPPEDRFDRITRLAASLFNVPMALISLVDHERQWFKSTHGLAVIETSRETSFCAHSVASRNALVVPDTFQDLRFADNPLVTGAPRIRFYAGYPLFVADCCVGTLCILDYRPREIDAETFRLLRDLAAVAEAELVTKAAEIRLSR